MSEQTIFRDWTPRLRATPFGFVSLPEGSVLPPGYLPARIVDQGRTLQAVGNDPHGVIATIAGTLNVQQQANWILLERAGALNGGGFSIDLYQFSQLASITVQSKRAVVNGIERTFAYDPARYLVLTDRVSDGQVRVRVQVEIDGKVVTIASTTVTLQDAGLGLKINVGARFVGAPFHLRLEQTPPNAPLRPTVDYRTAITNEAEIPETSGLYTALRAVCYGEQCYPALSAHIVDHSRIRSLYDPAALRTTEPASVHAHWRFTNGLGVGDHRVASSSGNLSVSVQPAPETEQATLINSRTPQATVRQSAVTGAQLGKARKLYRTSYYGAVDSATRDSRDTVLIGHQTYPALDIDQRSMIVGNAHAALLASLDQTVAMGHFHFSHLTEASESTLIGQRLMHRAAKIRKSIHVGTDHGLNSKNSTGNVWVGHALGQESDLQHSVLIGKHVVADTRERTVGFVALGFRAGFRAYNHAMAIGHDAQPSGDFAIQIGGPRHRIESYKGVAVRADERDALEVRSGQLGLDFLMRLKPKEVRWNYREHYLTDVAMPPLEPIAPDPVPADGSQEYQRYLAEQREYLTRRQQYETALVKRQQDISSRRLQLNHFTRARRDNHAESGFEQTLMAQDIAHAAHAVGAEFNGVRLDGGRDGLDVATWRPDQLIPPIVRAIQELNSEERVNDLIDRIALRVIELLDRRAP